MKEKENIIDLFEELKDELSFLPQDKAVIDGFILGYIYTLIF